MTLSALSAALGEPRIAVSTLAHYESGRRIPRLRLMQRIQHVTGIRADDFYRYRGMLQ